MFLWPTVQIENTKKHDNV